VQQIVPIALIIVFTVLYFFVKKIKERSDVTLWADCLIVAEIVCLLLVYLSGNYFIVREASEKLLNQYVFEGEDIPFAFLFYFLTVAIPLGYLYGGVKKKDIVLLRTSLAVLAFSVFTFKFYYSTGHHEITLTAAGIILLVISALLFRYLKTVRNGFTRENLLNDRWGNVNAEAFIISQTMGGNQGIPETPVEGGGGKFGGGGASGGF
jgi:hypothetical protein